MTRLFIDTSCDYLLLYVTSNDEIIGSVELKVSRKMSEYLLDQVHNLIQNLSLKITDINEIYAGIGPGSFTGVRIGVALALGLSQGLEVDVYGLSSMDVQAISKNQDHVKCISRLKGEEFAYREYDFINNTFSDYKVLNISNSNLDDYTLVNTDNKFKPDYLNALKSGKLLNFRTECSPIYLRKSEAEINLDKKSQLK